MQENFLYVYKHKKELVNHVSIRQLITSNKSCCIATMFGSRLHIAVVTSLKIMKTKTLFWLLDYSINTTFGDTKKEVISSFNLGIMQIKSSKYLI